RSHTIASASETAPLPSVSQCASALACERTNSADWMPKKVLETLLSVVRIEARWPSDPCAKVTFSPRAFFSFTSSSAPPEPHIELRLVDADDVSGRIGAGRVHRERVGEDERNHVSLAVGIDGRERAAGRNDGRDRRGAQIHFGDEKRPRLGEGSFRDVELERL